MTPARKAALQWFHDRGEVRLTQDRSPNGSLNACSVR